MRIGARHIDNWIGWAGNLRRRFAALGLSPGLADIFRATLLGPAFGVRSRAPGDGVKSITCRYLHLILFRE